MNVFKAVGFFVSDFDSFLRTPLSGTMLEESNQNECEFWLSKKKQMRSTNVVIFWVRNQRKPPVQIVSYPLID